MSFEHAALDWIDVSMARELAAARLTAHWAAQLPSAAGATLADPSSDFSHTALSWSGAQGMLVGVPLADGRCAALGLRDLSLVVLDDSGTPSVELGLAKRTLAEALEWLGDELGATLERPSHDLPPHAVRRGERFGEASTPALEQLTRWFGNAARMLDAVKAAEADASEVRCWPHHFDIATLISLDPPGTDAEEARSIGVGMTPGDGSIAMPYFYVTPWPYPEATNLPTLAGAGRWNTEGWVGALLRAEDLTDGDAGEQGAQIAAFLTSAMTAARALLI